MIALRCVAHETLSFTMAGQMTTFWPFGVAMLVI